MLGEIKLGVDLQVAGEASLGVAPGIDDEPVPSAADADVAAPGTMARFATGLILHSRVRRMHPSVSAGGKLAGVDGHGVRAELQLGGGSTRAGMSG